MNTPLITTIDDDHLPLFAERMVDWLLTDLDGRSFTESRAKALLRAGNMLDDATRHDFAKLMGQIAAVRVALDDLLQQSGLDEHEEIKALAAVSGHAHSEKTVKINWLVLTVAAFAWKSEYPLNQLDPTSPPGEYSPAGQVIKRSAYFMRQQIQRSATERDKLVRKLAYDGGQTAVSGTPSLDTLPTDQPIAPLPPYYRSPIPVRYPEVSRDTVQINPDEPSPPPTAVTRNDPLSITDDDLPNRPRPTPNQPVSRGELITITDEDLPPTLASRATAVAASASASMSGFNDAVRQKLSREKAATATTKLRILVQEYPDGPGLYGLQVHVRCEGIRSFIAGVTNREGQLLCELPVRATTGLTYDIDITWPRDFGGDVERKSITLNAERTEFILPFYRKISS